LKYFLHRLSTTQLKAFAGSGLPYLLKIRHLALNSIRKSPKALVIIPVSVPLLELREPEKPYPFQSS
jgi:hypothetical protein